MSISRARPFSSLYITPEKVVQEAKNSGFPSLSYTYNEPITSYEYVLDTAHLAKDSGIFNILVTNGYLEPEPLETLLPWLDAMNIDIKTFDPVKFKTFCGGKLETVLSTVKRAAAACHVEVTTLMVPGLCEVGDVVQTARWLSKIRPDIPLHITRYFPAKKGQAPPTPIQHIHWAMEKAARYLKHVFIGNM
jgi:pyruvate formate lyase activating enzyme